LELHRGKQIIEIAVAGRVIMDDPSAAAAACIAGQGAQSGLGTSDLGQGQSNGADTKVRYTLVMPGHVGAGRVEGRQSPW